MIHHWRTTGYPIKFIAHKLNVISTLTFNGDSSSMNNYFRYLEYQRLADMFTSVGNSRRFNRRLLRKGPIRANCVNAKFVASTRWPYNSDVSEPFRLQRWSQFTSEPDDQPFVCNMLVYKGILSTRCLPSG